MSVLTLNCSFCGKSNHEVAKLIAGPNVFICNECVSLCTGIVGEEAPKPVRDELLPVKAMLVDAFDRADIARGAATDLSPNGRFIQTESRIFDADKLATAVTEWFAAREGRSGILDEVSKAGTPEEVRYKSTNQN